MPATASVLLNVKDITRSMAFYKALGFKVPKTYDDDAGVVRYADLDLLGAEMTLADIGANNDKEFRAWVSTPLGAGIMVNFEVPNVDVIFARAEAAGATIDAPLADRAYGRTFSLNDPDGYVVSFTGRTPRRAAKKSRPKKAARKAARKAPRKTAKKAARSPRRR